ncbi:MAG: gliding motility-associated C-terminal domain-containing protein [Saprospiraceae bacterium]|nr:gliding motility-associated C-terminal domain-containing protein [Saprospiraceae bacterium]
MGNDSVCVVVCYNDGVCDTTVYKLVASDPVPKPSRKFVVRDTIFSNNAPRTKSDFTKPLDAVGITNICASSSGTRVRFDVNPATQSVTYTPLSVGTDSACIQICNAMNECDTTILYVTVVPPRINGQKVDTIRVKIFERKSYTPDSSALAGSPLVPTNPRLCDVNPSLNNSDITLEPVTKSVIVIGRNTGVDTICVSLTNAAGLSDSTRLYIIVEPDTFRTTPNFENVTLAVNQSVTRCIDSSELASGRLLDVRNCTVGGVTAIDNSTLTIQNATKCVILRGSSVGRDTMCVFVCNSVGLCDTTTFYINVVQDLPKPTSSTVQVEVEVDEEKTVCDIDLTQIGGVVSRITDACPGKNGSKARMAIDNVTNCVRIAGLTPGRDTACVVVSNDDTGLSDTTFVVVRVRGSNIPIEAVDDIDSVRQSSRPSLRMKDSIYVYRNDDLKGQNPISLDIITPPTKGLAEVISFSAASGGVIKYDAFESVYNCGIDSLRYRVCIDDENCAEAVLLIDIKCSPVVRAFNAFSPKNNDQINDVFYIEGLNNIPDNTLLIFNRWGNQVLKVKNYENNWRGEWNNSDVPDGTYFYILRDDSKGEIILSGSLQIMR